MAIRAFNVVADPWIKGMAEEALGRAEPSKGGTYWDWRDKVDDSFYVYVAELNGQVLYVGQTARGADARLRDHNHPAAGVRVVRFFGYRGEIARINVGSRNEALGLESELARVLREEGFMVSTGQKPSPRPDFRWIPGNMPASTVSLEDLHEPFKVQAIGIDDHYWIALSFLWERTQLFQKGKGVAPFYIPKTRWLLSTEEWTYGQWAIAWKILHHHRKQLLQCADLHGRPLPPPKRDPQQNPALLLDIDEGMIWSSGRGAHPVLSTISRFIPQARYVGGRLVAPLDAAVHAALDQSLPHHDDVLVGDSLAMWLAQTPG